MPDPVSETAGRTAVSSRKKNCLWFAVGFIWGAAAMFVGGMFYLRSAIIVEKEIPCSVESFSKNLPDVAEDFEWIVTPESCRVPAPEDGSQLRTFKLCQPDIAKFLVSRQDWRKLSAVLPCSVAVYEKKFGDRPRVYLARLNMPLIAYILGGMPSWVYPRYITPVQQEIIDKTVLAAPDRKK